MLDHVLIHKIDTGRCFALVGSGPSCELTYPSWRKLATDVFEIVRRDVTTADIESYSRFLDSADYPAIFRQAECDLGGRDSLLQHMVQLLVPSSSPPPQPVYGILARWPFACYLTTNYDDELSKYLKASRQHYEVIQNTVDELALFRDGATNLIAKLHGDLSHPERMILTSKDYDNALTSPDWEPWRAKVRQIFEMFDVFIIGHSMNDPDLRLILQIAKHTVGSMHPMYMIVANPTRGQIREYREQFNIQIIPYKDTDGSHVRLKRMLQVADRFVVPRGQLVSASQYASPADYETAVALTLHRRLRLIPSSDLVNDSLVPLVLNMLYKSTNPLNVSEIATNRQVVPFTDVREGEEAVRAALDFLTREGYVQEQNKLFTCTEHGRARVDQIHLARKTEEKQALGQFSLALRAAYPQITDAESTVSEQALRDTLVRCFRDRGLAMAKVIFSGNSLGNDDLPDIFRVLTESTAQFESFDLRAAFVETAYNFVVEPNGPQKGYLASISQGYFLYHLAGCDPTCKIVRRDVFQGTCWFLDSSVLLPLLAKGCHNHSYAADFFARLKTLGAQLHTTDRLVRESWEHLNWAINFVSSNSSGSAEWLALAQSKDSYKENLFLDGYIRLAAEGEVTTFEEYLELCFSSLASLITLKDALRAEGIAVLALEQIQGFDQIHWADWTDLVNQVRQYRMTRGTFRRELQVEAEAEVLLIIRKARAGAYMLPSCGPILARAYFVSQSRALDAVATSDEVVTWTPEAVYRFATALDTQDGDPSLLQQCMLHEYFYAGVSFVDKTRYTRFFGPAINQAKIDYEREVERYVHDNESRYSRKDVDEAFESTPDLEKPFFVMQMGWECARIAQEKSERAEQLAASVQDAATQDAKAMKKRLKATQDEAREERKRRITAEQTAARYRNLQDPKHVKKLLRQKKKKGKKK